MITGRTFSYILIAFLLLTRQSAIAQSKTDASLIVFDPATKLCWMKYDFSFMAAQCYEESGIGRQGGTIYL